MPNLPMTFLLHVAASFVGVAALRVSGVRTRLIPYFTATGVIAAYWILSNFGFPAQTALFGKSALHWNWIGKIFVIVAALAFLSISGFGREDVGLTWRQRPGSVIPALGMVALLCGIAWIDEALLADGTSLASETLMFQASMPGLDEELVFRGILFALLSNAFAGSGVEQGNGRLWGGIFVTAFFAAGHALFVVDGSVRMDWHALLVTGTLGAGFMWLRVRTNSLVLPVVAHNLCNFGGLFF